MVQQTTLIKREIVLLKKGSLDEIDQRELQELRESQARLKEQEQKTRLGLLKIKAQLAELNQILENKNQQNTTQNWGLYTVQPNAYGLGTGMNQYGQPVRYQVIGQPNADTSLLQVQPNAYGLGVGMDQFGRAVRVVPAR